MAYANFQVAIKSLIFNKDKVLTLITPDGYIDFPGGRVDDSEYNLDFKDALQRELKEELGSDLCCAIKELIFITRRYYNYNGEHHVVALFYESQYISGIINLSDEHAKYEWLTPKQLLNKNAKFMSKSEQSELLKYLNKYLV